MTVEILNTARDVVARARVPQTVAYWCIGADSVTNRVRIRLKVIAPRGHGTRFRVGFGDAHAESDLDTPIALSTWLGSVPVIPVFDPGMLVLTAPADLIETWKSAHEQA